jgi:hypothetical protein
VKTRVQLDSAKVRTRRLNHLRVRIVEATSTVLTSRI